MLIFFFAALCAELLVVLLQAAATASSGVPARVDRQSRFIPLRCCLRAYLLRCVKLPPLLALAVGLGICSPPCSVQLSAGWILHWFCVWRSSLNGYLLNASGAMVRSGRERSAGRPTSSRGDSPSSCLFRALAAFLRLVRCQPCCLRLVVFPAIPCLLSRAPRLSRLLVRHHCLARVLRRAGLFLLPSQAVASTFARPRAEPSCPARFLSTRTNSSSSSPTSSSRR